MVFAELLIPNRSIERYRCELLWYSSHNCADLIRFESCIRELIVDDFYPNQAKLLAKPSIRTGLSSNVDDFVPAWFAINKSSNSMTVPMHSIKVFAKQTMDDDSAV